MAWKLVMIRAALTLPEKLIIAYTGITSGICTGYLLNKAIVYAGTPKIYYCEDCQKRISAPAHSWGSFI